MASVSVSDRTMVYGRAGFVTDEAKTAAEAIEAAGLDWTVSLRQTFFDGDGEGTMSPVRNKLAVVRDDTHEALGVVGTRYTPFQNVETFAFADQLAAQGGLFESAFTQCHGSVVGLTMRFPDGVMIGGEDPVEKYLILRSKHDGSGCLIGGIGMLRMGCLNQFDSTLNRSASQIRLPHTHSLERQAAQAAAVLELSYEAADTFVADAEQMLALKMTDKQVDALIESVLKEQALSDAARGKTKEAITDSWKNTPTIPDSYRKTGWGVLNGIGEYFDWVFPYRNEQSRLASTIDGRGAHAKKVAQRLLLNR